MSNPHAKGLLLAASTIRALKNGLPKVTNDSSAELVAEHTGYTVAIHEIQEHAMVHVTDAKERAALRDPDYATLSPEEQWAEDKRLGILDWDGT